MMQNPIYKILALLLGVLGVVSLFTAGYLIYQTQYNWIELRVASSSTKKAWLDEVVKNFNAEQHLTSQGSIIRVTVAHVTSGGSQNALATGDEARLSVSVWSPGSKSWVDGFPAVWRRNHSSAEPMPSLECEPTVYTPLGIAMWQHQAAALGWPEEAKLGWRTILELASAPNGWASKGHQDWGEFRFGLANPSQSNAGLLTMTALAYTILDKPNVLTLTISDLESAQLKQRLQQLFERENVEVIDNTEKLLDKMIEQGSKSYHAVATFESNVLQANERLQDEKLVFIFPHEGTFWGDHPYCILRYDQISDEETVEAADTFLYYILARRQQALAVKHGLRPIHPYVQFSAAIDDTSIDINPDRSSLFSEPDAELAEAIKHLFAEVW